VPVAKLPVTAPTWAKRFERAIDEFAPTQGFNNERPKMTADEVFEYLR
jgi:hypothetical protein